MFEKHMKPDWSKMIVTFCFFGLWLDRGLHVAFNVFDYKAPLCFSLLQHFVDIVVRLREHRRTPLHRWRSQMCKRLFRILATSARIFKDPWRLECLQQTAAAFANFNAKTQFKNR